MSTATAAGAETKLSTISPLDDHRWDEFINNHPLSSVFHTRAWLTALQRTYGYQPVALASASPDASLQNGIVFCRVDSWITGRRLVSVPFADHCAPLIADPAQLSTFIANLKESLPEPGLKYLELRPRIELPAANSAFSSVHSYCLHELDLSPPLETLFQNFHKDSIQRKIRRAEKERLTYDEGRSQDLVEIFYRLLVKTRQRHGLPPQPIEWFHNLTQAFGEALKIRVAFSAGRAIAAILTLQYKDTLVYKYGASDVRFSASGGTQLLFWESIQEAKRRGLRRFDLGRSDWSNSGLITFKKRWGASAAKLAYFRMPVSSTAMPDPLSGDGDWLRQRLKHFLQLVPRPALRWIGRRIYRHIG